jgi:hypothetical protein
VNTTMRRLATILALSLVTVGWAVPASAAASAGSLKVSGTETCDPTGATVVDWIVSSVDTTDSMDITAATVTPSSSTLDGSGLVGKTVPAASAGAGSATGRQRVPQGSRTAGLSVTAADASGAKLTASATIDLSLTCGVAKPSYTFERACDGSLVINLSNAADATSQITIVVDASGPGGSLHQAYTLEPKDVVPVSIPADRLAKLQLSSSHLLDVSKTAAELPAPSCAPAPPNPPANNGGAASGNTHNNPPASPPAGADPAGEAAPQQPPAAHLPDNAAVRNLPSTGMSAATTGTLAGTAGLGLVAIAAGIAFIIVSRRRQTALARPMSAAETAVLPTIDDRS